MKWVGIALLAIFALFLLWSILGLIGKGIGSTLSSFFSGWSKTTNKKSCDEQIKALTSFEKYSHSTVKTVHLDIPTESSASSTSKVWVEPGREWTRDEFNKRVDEIMREQFGLAKSGKLREKLDFPSQTESRESSKWIKIKESTFFKNLFEKMMDFVSSRYALTNVNFHSEEFNQQYQLHVKEVKDCTARVEELRRKISDLLAQEKGTGSSLDSLSTRLTNIDYELQGLGKKYEPSLRDVQNQLSKIEDEISGYNTAKRDRDSYENRRAAKDSLLSTQRAKLSPIKSEIDRLESLRLKYVSELGRSPGSQDRDILKQIEELTKRRDLLRRELNLLTQSDEIYHLAIGLGLCDVTKIEQIELKLASNEADQKELKRILGPNDDLVKELDKDARQVKDIIDQAKSLHEKAQFIKLKNFKQKREKFLKEIADITSTIEELERKLSTWRDQQSIL